MIAIKTSEKIYELVEKKDLNKLFKLLKKDYDIEQDLFDKFLKELR